MPLTGFVCCQTGQVAPVEHCLQCARTGEPGECVYPLPLLKSIAGNEATRKGAGNYSATTLQGCARQVILMREAPYAENPEFYEARFFGTLGHDHMYQELKDEPDAIAEVRLFRDIEIDGRRYRISGKPDWVLPRYIGGGMVVDFKNAGKRVLGLSAPTRVEHEWQAGGVYPWLLADGEPEEVVPGMDEWLDAAGHLHIPVALAEIDYFYTGSPRQIQKVKVPVKSAAETEAYIRERMIDHVNWEEHGKLPPVLPSTYKKDRKTGELETVRHWMCQKCPVRGECDYRALEEAWSWEELDG